MGPCDYEGENGCTRLIVFKGDFLAIKPMEPTMGKCSTVDLHKRLDFSKSYSWFHKPFQPPSCLPGMLDRMLHPHPSHAWQSRWEEDDHHGLSLRRGSPWE